MGRGRALEARRSATQNTLPLELAGLTTTTTNPEIYALGTMTTAVSFLMIGLSFAAIAAWRWLRAAR